MNYIVLCLTAKLLKFNSSKIRIIIAATVGSITMIVCILKGMFIFNIIFVSFIMMRIVTGKVSKRLFIMYVLVMWVVAFAIGGGINALLNINGRFFSKNSLLEIIVLSVLISVFVKIGIWFLYEKNHIDKCICDVKLEYHGEVVHVRGIIDTGNSLYEPISHKPVSIIEAELIKGNIEGIYVIPYKSIGTENGILYGVKAEKMTVCDNGIAYINENVIVAIYKGRLSSDKRFEMIIHSDMIHSNMKGET